MPTGSDYLPVATASGANVDSQANFAGSGYQTTGFVAGVAKSNQANKVWRQASMVASAVTNYISNQLGLYVNDDGNITSLIANLTAAIAAHVTAILTAAGLLKVFGWTDETGSRAFNVPYQNESGREMEIAGYCLTHGSSVGNIQLQTGPTSGSMTFILWWNEKTATVEGAPAQFGGKIPEGWWYQLVPNGAVYSIGKWYEGIYS